MNTNQKDQFGQGSQRDENNRQASARNNESGNTNSQASRRNPETSDDDFLSGDNAKKTYPNNQNNPNEGYQAAGRGSNPNIGGNESEYESSTSAESDNYEEADLANNEPMNRRDSEEIDRHDEETRYSSPSSRNRAEE